MFDAFREAAAPDDRRGRIAASAGVAVGAHGGLIALAIIFAGHVVAPPLPEKKVDVTFTAPPPPPDVPKPRVEPRHELKTQLTRADVAPPVTTTSPAQDAPSAKAAEPQPIPTEAPKASAPEAAEARAIGPSAGASLGAVAQKGTVGGTGTQAINLPESGEPAVASPDNVAPRMPIEAEAGGWEGRVVLKGIINVDGSVSQLQVLKVTVTIGGQTSMAAADHPFAREALAAARTWRFTPAKVDGQAVAVYRIFPITYVSH